MRLSSETRQIIKREAADLLGADCEVRLFGSRLDDDQRGGDIDLLIATPHVIKKRVELECRLAARRYLTAMATSATPDHERRCSPWPFPSPRPSPSGRGGEGALRATFIVRLGGRKVDVLIKDIASPDSPIHRQAMQHGVVL